MTKRQKSILVGLILGDAYLQKTGKQNARIRLEHSIKQKEYLEWKILQLSNFFQTKIQTLERKNPILGKTYTYVRAQSMSSSEIGKLQRFFYRESIKVIPDTIQILLKNPLSLAVWFMDDGYYYQRDNISYIYIPNYEERSRQLLLQAFKDNFQLMPVVKSKKRRLVLVFNVNETKNLMELIKRFVIPSMQYKIPFDPVSTDRNPLNMESSEIVL